MPMADRFRPCFRVLYPYLLLVPGHAAHGPDGALPGHLLRDCDRFLCVLYVLHYD
jgi:hypothetical protein